MTKVIAVLRHAQSAGKQSGQRDYDRVLTPSGEASARALGKKLLEHGFKTGLILSSSSARSRQTTVLVNESLQLPEDKILFKHELYEALMIDWLDHIHDLPGNLDHIILVGHNPWLSMLSSNFAGNVTELHPGELIAFEFDVDDWANISDHGRKVLNIKPAENDH